MHDTLEYFQTAPADRAARYHKLTFSMMYFYNDRYLLPFSHDEVVHGKASILNKMNGQYEDKFPHARAMYLYMMVHPGKKLNFMGNEIGQFREWDEKREQDWSLQRYPAHDAFYRYMAELNRIYLSHSALWAEDYWREGFAWLDCHQEEKCVYIVERRSEEETLIAAFNFSAQEQTVEIELTAALCKAQGHGCLRGCRSGRLYRCREHQRMGKGRHAVGERGGAYPRPYGDHARTAGRCDPRGDRRDPDAVYGDLKSKAPA